jgi:hypothetical protein
LKETWIFSFSIDFLNASILMIILFILGLLSNLSSSNHWNAISMFCKICSSTDQSFYIICWWLMIMSCIDRYLVYSDHIRLRKYANSHIAYCLMKKISFISLLLPWHYFIFVDIRKTWCMHTHYSYSLYHSIFTFIFDGFLLLWIMIICFILIGKSVALKQIHRRRYVSD